MQATITEPAAGEAAELTIGRKVFRITNAEDLDTRQDGWITAKLERAGLTDPRLRSLKGEALLKEARLRLMERGLVGDFLAGYLVERGKPWANASAEAHSKLFNTLKDGTGRQELFELLDGLLLGFFSFAHGSWPTGPSSSMDPAAAASSARAAASTTGTGSPSSGD